MRKKISVLLTVLVFSLSVFAFANTRFVASNQATVTISREEYERLSKYKKLDEVAQIVNSHFYKEVDQKKLIEGAIAGLLKGTEDVYSFYYNEESWEKLWEDDEGKYAGIGVQLLGDWRNDTVTVTRVFKNTPAESAGIKKGDVFYKVEELEITPSTMSDATKIMRGIPGEKVHVELVRDGEILKFDITKAEIHVNQVESAMLENNIGYIAVYQFAGEVAKDFEKAFQDLTKKGMKGLVIDLRDNPGGWVEASKSMADLFLDNKLLFYTEDRQGKREDTFTQSGASDIPLCVLVNENSASSSEIFAAAMKDHKRASVVGSKTFGKGIIQSVLSLQDGKTGFQLTVAQYFSPNGNPVHKTGIEPDIELLMPDELKNELFQLGDLSDPQLKKAYETLMETVK